MRILLLDNSPLVRDAVADLLTRTFPAASIEATGLTDRLGLPSGVRPDLVVVNMTGLGGDDLQPLASLATGASPSPLIVLDSRARADRAQMARKAGCRGYIPLTDAGALVAAALTVVSAGGEYYPAGMTDVREDVAPDPFGKLSARQQDVARRLAQGMTNREIADDLGIAVPTVKLHVHAILAAVGVRNRTEAALWARSATSRARTGSAAEPPRERSTA